MIELAIKIVVWCAMVVILYRNIFSGNKKESWTEVVDANSTLTLVRFLYLIAGLAIISSFLFQIEWLSVPALIAIIGILIATKKEKEEKVVQVLATVVFVVLIMGFFVPTHRDSFLKHVSSNGTYECLYDFECVKVTSIITSDDLIKTEAEVMPVADYTFHWYGIIATGSMVIEEGEDQQETLKGFNIAGFWIDY
ncbi:hypothetical protein P6709_09850 [Jeotgalibacillus sp. ET6]|uniref:hypothetical protein n=1 Tax=Jeotgalibacillus sp. ET6 TaxID=3037260 RepID=UPI0024188377|nr:hypothetical protein [Jeotgalibacillus sp. ET6]MDG5472054.1 hypothetical protein [Jeotgalibacillus sp. ET6]